MGQIDNIMQVMEGKWGLHRRQSIEKCSSERHFFNLIFKSIVNHRGAEVIILAVSSLG